MAFRHHNHPNQREQPQEGFNTEAFTERVLAVYNQQAQRIQDAFTLAMESNNTAFDNALKTIIAVLGPHHNNQALPSPSQERGGGGCQVYQHYDPRQAGSSNSNSSSRLSITQPPIQLPTSISRGGGGGGGDGGAHTGLEEEEEEEEGKEEEEEEEEEAEEELTALSASTSHPALEERSSNGGGGRCTSAFSSASSIAGGGEEEREHQDAPCAASIHSLGPSYLQPISRGGYLSRGGGGAYLPRKGDDLRFSGAAFKHRASMEEPNHHHHNHHHHHQQQQQQQQQHEYNPSKKRSRNARPGDFRPISSSLSDDDDPPNYYHRDRSERQGGGGSPGGGCPPRGSSSLTSSSLASSLPANPLPPKLLSYQDLSAAVRDFLRGFERYLFLEHISPFTGQPLAPLTVANRLSQAQRLLLKGGVEVPTEDNVEALRRMFGQDRNTFKLVGDMLTYLESVRKGIVRGGGGRGEGEDTRVNVARYAAFANAERDEEEMMIGGWMGGSGIVRRGRGPGSRGGRRGRGRGSRGGRRGRGGGRGRWSSRGEIGLLSPLQRQEIAATAGGGDGGSGTMMMGIGSVASSASSSASSIGGQIPRLDVCKDFLRWMRVEDDGARVSNSTAYAYHLILTELLLAVGCELSRLKGPEDLKRYVLNHREEIEELVPPNRAPYPKERGAWKKVWEWASGERIWEEEGGHHLAGGGLFYHRGNGLRTRVRGKEEEAGMAATGEEGEEGEEGVERVAEEEKEGVEEDDEEEEVEEDGEMQGEGDEEENDEEEEEGEASEEELTSGWRGSRRLAAKRARTGTEGRLADAIQGGEEGEKEGGSRSGSGADGVPKHWLLMDPVSSLLGEGGGGGGKELAAGKKQASL